MKPNDVIVTLVTSYDVTVPPDGHHLDVDVGAVHDVGRFGSTSVRWGSWDPNGSCPPIKTRIQGQIEKRITNLSRIQ